MGSLNGKSGATKDKAGTAEAFYLVFCPLRKRDRLTVARYIFQDDEIRKSIDHFEVPNAVTSKALEEDTGGMPQFDTIDELRQDLLS